MATLTPKQLANEIGCDPKSLRGFLRKNFTRTNEVKNTSWLIEDDAANAAREHFAKQKTNANAKDGVSTVFADLEVAPTK
jgi:hypothetical protein